MSNIRCVHNAELEVMLPDGTTFLKKFTFGTWYKTTKWEVINDEYINIELNDGNRIEGVRIEVFENHGTPTSIATDEVKIIKPKVDPPAKADYSSYFETRKIDEKEAKDFKELD